MSSKPFHASSYATNNNLISVAPYYSAFAWQMTVEGTFKKGISRILGTCFGGLTAWIGIMLSSWSYNGTSTINPYALTAWLTVISIVAARIGTDPGPAGMLGSSYDVGFISQYFAMILAVVSLETYIGMGDINDMTVNRVVATITGVLTAMVVALIPPYTRGRDPDLVLDYCFWLIKSLDAVIQALLKHGKLLDRDRFETIYMGEAEKKRKFAKFVLYDSGTLHFLKYFRIPEELNNAKSQLVVDESIISQLADIAAKEHIWCRGDNHAACQLTEDDRWNRIVAALQAILDGKDRKDLDIDPVIADLSTPPEVASFLRAASNHRARMVRTANILTDLQNQRGGRGIHASKPAWFPVPVNVPVGSDTDDSS